MTRTTTDAGTLRIVRRLPSSHYGNPRYLVTIGARTYRTASNAMFGYEVTNYDGKDVVATVGPYYGKPTIHRASLITTEAAR